MSALSTREALIRTMARTRVTADRGDLIAGAELGEWIEFLADHLIASGAVVDATTLADDAALVERGDVAEAIWLHRSAGVDHVDYTAKCFCGRKFVTAVERQRHAAQKTLRALAAALTERGA